MQVGPPPHRCDLADRHCAVTLDGDCGSFESWNRIVVPEIDMIEHDRGQRRCCGATEHHDRSAAARCFGCVVGDQLFRGESTGSHVGAVAGRDDAVGDFLVAERKRREEQWKRVRHRVDYLALKALLWVGVSVVLSMAVRR